MMYHLQTIVVILQEGSYVDSQKLVSENRPVDPSSWNYASGQKPTDRRMLMKYPRQQAIKQVCYTYTHTNL